MRSIPSSTSRFELGEIVNNHTRVAGLLQLDYGVRSNVAGTAGYEDCAFSYCRVKSK